MPSLHEAVFIWPSTAHNSVILTGTFDNWSSSIHLTKGADGFTGKVSIPYGQKILYKYIVDGNWTTASGQTTETDGSGNVNNVYTAPVEPAEETVSEEKPAATGLLGHLMAAASRTIEEVPEPVKEVTDSAAATAGTSSAVEYVATGVSGAIATVTGVDLINQDKIPVEEEAVTETKAEETPAPADVLPEPVKEVADSAAATAGTSSAVEYVATGVSGAIATVTGVDLINKDKILVEEEAAIETTAEETPAPAEVLESKPVQEVLEESAPPAPVAPDVPIAIVPVKDATTDSTSPTAEQVLSTHAPVAPVETPAAVIVTEDALTAPATVDATVAAAPVETPAAVVVTEDALTAPATADATADAPTPPAAPPADGPTADPTAITQAAVNADIQAAAADPKPSEVSFPSADKEAANGSPSHLRSNSAKYDTTTMRKKRGSIFGSIRAFPSSSEKLPTGEDSEGEAKPQPDAQRKERRVSLFGKIKGAISPKKRTVSSASTTS